VLRIDYTYPPTPGDVAQCAIAPPQSYADLFAPCVLALTRASAARARRSPNSYFYQTTQATVKGLTFEEAWQGEPLTAEQDKAMHAAVAQLEAAGVCGITGDCGFLMNYQSSARAMAYADLRP
jgi:hypothetical protein